jgi:hypothetical protein
VGAKLTELTKVQAEYIGVERRPEASAQRPSSRRRWARSAPFTRSTT